MKYAVIIMDGAADLPIESLNGMTPLAAARIGRTDALAAAGRCGAVQTVPADFHPGSDVAIMSLVGYDPAENYTGRAPLEAAAMGIETGPDEWIFRCNLVTTEDGRMLDHSGGNISNESARRIVRRLDEELGGEGIRFYPGVSYRNILVLKADLDVQTTPPHDILDKPFSAYLPTGRGSEVLKDLIERSAPLVAEDPHGRATRIWLWGQGKPGELEPFARRFGPRGAVITAVDLVRGIGRLVGFDVLDVPGATGYYDTDYAAKGRRAIEALRRYDLVLVHVEASDEAGHEGNVEEKVAALERIDEMIVGPIHDALAGGSDAWRMLVLPDHPTPCAVRTHTREPVPYCMAGHGVSPDSCLTFTEKIVEASKRPPAAGHTLMETLTS